MAATGPSSPDTPKETTAAAGTSSGAAEMIKSDGMTTAMSQPTTNPANEKKSHAPSSSSSPTTKINIHNIMPTYLSTQSSKAYTLSKQLLSAGSLDDALSTLEMALQISREMLVNNLNNNDNSDGVLSTQNDNDNGNNDVNIELHESLAPLYYLYGTTLLYSVEESDAMMAATPNPNGGAPNDIDMSPEDNVNEQPQDDDGAAEQSTMMVIGGAYDDGEESGATNEVQEVADPTEDLQIAWENLDLARSIVTRLVEGFKPTSTDNNTNDIGIGIGIGIGAGNLKSENANDDIFNSPVNNGITYTNDEQTSLFLDLAQIHTRLGDLQRANANILPSIDDYNLALDLRMNCLGKFDKKVADSHFSLGQVYAEAPNRVGENEGKVSEFVNNLGATAAAGNEEEEKGIELSEEEKNEMRRKSLEHYLACGVAFAGLLAKICGDDPEKLTTLETGGNDNGGASVDDSMAAASMACAKPLCTNYAKQMTTLRERLSSLPQTNLSPANKDEFNDLKEMLDEIQEAIDEAEGTEDALKSLGEMKANEIKKHEMKKSSEDNVETCEDRATTTIGFGAPSSTSTSSAFAVASSSAARHVSAFGSSSSSTLAAPTMMVVKKKKKKKKAVVQSLIEDESAKRRKTSE